MERDGFVRDPSVMLRTDLHGSSMWIWDVASASEGNANIPWIWLEEGLGFNLCVAPTGSLGPSIS